MTRMAWAWYGAWTAVDYYTTVRLYGIYHEANPLVTWLMTWGLSIDTTLAVLVLAVTALLAAMYASNVRVLRAAAVGAMWVRATSAVSNLVLVATGRSLIDYIIITLNIPPAWAVAIVTLIPVAIAVARGL